MAASLIGVDVVDLDRIARSLERGDALAHRLLADTERAWVDAAPAGRVTRLAACLGLKEAAIKALGGRPPGFNWAQLVREESSAAPAWMTAAVHDLGVDDVQVATMTGQSAAWGVVDDAIVAVVAAAQAVVESAVARVVTDDDAGTDALTAAELEYCGASVERRAGRRAARTAVLRLLGAAHASVETLPGVHPPKSSRPCLGESHPPRVLINGDESDVRVTISHGPSVAVAIAWRV